MAFARRSGGGIPDIISEATIHASVSNETWRRAEELARAFLARVMAATMFSHWFGPCVAALEHHIGMAGTEIGRLG